MLALSKVQVPQLAIIHRLIEEVGSAKELIENATNIRDIFPEASPKLSELLGDETLIEWSSLRRTTSGSFAKATTIIHTALPNAATHRWYFTTWAMPISMPST